MKAGGAEAALERGIAALGLEVQMQARERLLAYVALVTKWQRIANLTGARDQRRFVSEHLVDCLAVVPALDSGFTVDVGSGAGLPGLVLATLRPTQAVTLVEPRAKRARFLTQAALELGLDRVDVCCAPVETLRLDTTPRYVIARAFASLETFVRATDHLVGPATERVAMKAVLDERDRAAAERLAGPARVVELEVPGFEARRLVFFPGRE